MRRCVFMDFRSGRLSLTESLFISSACIAFTTVTEEDMHAFNQYACVDREPVDIHCMKSDLGAPDLPADEVRLEIVKIHLMIAKQRYS